MGPYYLDSRYEIDYTMDSGREGVLELTIKLGMKVRIRVAKLKGQLVEGMISYCGQERFFGCTAHVDSDPHPWWSDQSDNRLIRMIALQLINFRSSSANIERIFSLSGNFQGLDRTKLSLDLLTRFATDAHNLKLLNLHFPQPICSE